MPLTKITELVKEEFAAVNTLIDAQLHSDITLIEQLSEHIIGSGGKRLRPLIILLSAKACGYQGDAQISLAASLEFFHTATLLHDDVVDNSELRRGNKTANAIWGNTPSVLVGDFLFTRAFQLILKTENLKALRVLADTSNTITKGEVLQLINCNNPHTSEENYMRVICCKTSTLFEAAACLGPILAENSETKIQALANYGLHLGNTFQLVDDALDYCASSDDLGKNIGDDLAEGKPTLPLIYALRQGSAAQQKIIQEAIEKANTENLEAILEIIQDTKAIEYTYKVAREETDKALTELAVVSDSPYKQALKDLSEFALRRQS